MPAPLAPLPLVQQYDDTQPITVTVKTKVVSINGTTNVGAAGTATYTIPALNGAQPPAKIRALLELLDEAVRDGSATVA